MHGIISNQGIKGRESWGYRGHSHLQIWGDLGVGALPEEMRSVHVCINKHTRVYMYVNIVYISIYTSFFLHVIMFDILRILSA